MAMEKDRSGTYVLLIFLILIFGLSYLTYCYRHDARFTKIASVFKKGFHPVSHIMADLVVIADIDDKMIRLRLRIPCEDLFQKRALMRCFPRIQHKMLMSMADPVMKEWLEHRDLKAIKKHALRLVNNNSSIKVERLYMQNFFYN